MVGLGFGHYLLNSGRVDVVCVRLRGEGVGLVATVMHQLGGVSPVVYGFI